MREMFKHQKEAFEKVKDLDGAMLNIGCGGGKFQPFTSDILTRNGYIKMGSVKIGDKILDGMGNECSVAGIFPQGMQDVYKIHFSDNTYIRVGLDHINRFIVKGNRKHSLDKLKDANKHIDITTRELQEEMLKGVKSFWCELPVCNFNESLTEAQMPIAPYLLGLLLGDGGLTRNITFTNMEDDILDYVKQTVALYNCSVKPSGKSPYHYRITKGRNVKIQHLLLNRIRELGVNVESHHKFIPDIYKYASKEVRLAVLQGLFDTDGSVSIKEGRKENQKSSTREFTTVSKQLAEDVSFLYRSLGCVVKTVERIARYKKNGKYTITGKSYRLCIFTPKGFQISRSAKHNARLTDFQKDFPMRKVVGIEKEMGQELCQCILVDSPEHTYITNNVTVTHNTTVAIHTAEYKGLDTLIITPKPVVNDWKNELLAEDVKEEDIWVYDAKEASKKGYMEKFKEWLEK